MFLTAKILLLKLLILLGLILYVLGDCLFDVPSVPAIAPSFSIYVGSHKLKLNPNKYSNGVIKLHEQQELEAECDIGFEEPDAYKISNKVYIKCQGNYIYISTDKQHRQHNDYYRRTTLQCSLFRWNLYESSSNFDWCPFNVTSYILARPKFGELETPLYNYLAGICYDIYNNSFQSIYYTIAPNKYEDEQPQTLQDSYQPALKIEFIQETFGTNSFPKHAFENFQVKEWITKFKYEFYTFTTPAQLYITPIDQFSTLIEFVWWSNLRVFNWKRFVDALAMHVEKDNETYDILAGVSGAIKVPIETICRTNYTMEEVVFDTNRKIPLYVWNYLQSRSNSSNDVVIIGFNSPFNEFHAERGMKFCEDRCREIPWLKDASKTFQYKIMGSIICCSVEDVRSAKILQGFPEKDFNRKSAETFTYDEVSAETDATENYV